MKVLVLVTALLSACGVEAYMPKAPKQIAVPKKPAFDLSKAAAGAVAAFTIAASAATVTSLPSNANAAPWQPSSSISVAEKVVREGIYGEFEYDMPEQKYDDARSTFKSAKETKSKKGKYTALLAVLIVGSFVIPMAQYWWYVKDDDSSEEFFQKAVQEAEPPKKKGWF